jgi:hypothetical protein
MLAATQPLDPEEAFPSPDAIPPTAAGTLQPSRVTATKTALDPHDATAPISCDTIIRCPHTHLPVVTPFRPAAWHQFLTHYPNRNWAHRLVFDLLHGVDIGFRGTRRLRRASRNLTSVPAEDAAITADPIAEVALHHIAGPFKQSPFRHYVCSPLKTVPNKGNATKFRIIHHLSYPHGRSINSFTADWPCSLAGFDHAVRIVRVLGQGCYMAKVDVKAAYRCIPVRPADWPLLGMHWQGWFYFHRTLPFGLRSACHLWERYATAMEWVIHTHFHVPHITHYVDDTFLANSKDLCARDLARTKDGMAALGVPDAADKTEGPTTALTYLGIRIDSAAMSISLDAAKLAAILTLLGQWCTRSTCSLRELQSLIGTLQWAAFVVRHGRTSCSTSATSSPRTRAHPPLSQSIYRMRPRKTSAGGSSKSLSGTESVCCGSNSGSTAPRPCSPTPTPVSPDTPPSSAPDGFTAVGRPTRSAPLKTPP